MWIFLIPFLFLQFNSTHFEFAYPKEIGNNEIEFIANQLEKNYRELENGWGFEGFDKIKVKIFSTVYDFIKETHSAKEIGGIYYNKVIHLQPISILKKRKILNSILSHEVAHAFLDKYTSLGLPKWLNESFAIYFSNEISRIKKRKSLLFNHFTDLELLLSNEGKQNEAYFYLGLTMQFFIESYSKDKVTMLMKSFSSKNQNQSICLTLNESIEQIEKKWKKYIVRFN